MTLTDTIDLVAITPVLNEYGEVTGDSVPTTTTVMCDSGVGIKRSEFYEAYRSGIKLSAAFEMWACDYSGQTIVDYGGKRYKVERTYPISRDVVQLVCSLAT